MINQDIQKHLGFALLIIATGLFFPGILLPMFSLNMEMAIAVSGTNITSTLLDKELSIIATVEELWQQNRPLVSVLIFVFSVVVPVMKTSLVSVVYFTKNHRLRKKLINFVATIGKWSMADVFVVAVFLTIMSTNHANTAQQEEVSFFGMRIGFEISSQTVSQVGQGFYFFVGYCLLSILATQIVLKSTTVEKTLV